MNANGRECQLARGLGHPPALLAAGRRIGFCGIRSPVAGAAFYRATVSACTAKATTVPVSGAAAQPVRAVKHVAADSPAKAPHGEDRPGGYRSMEGRGAPHQLAAFP